MKKLVEKISGLAHKVMDFFGIDVKISRGSKRIAILFKKQGFVVKVPRIRLIKTIRHVWRVRNHNGDLYIFFFFKNSHAFHTAYSLLLGGIFDNWREYKFSKNYGDQPFIVPTIFSFFGLVNVMRLGQPLVEKNQIFHTLRRTSSEELRRVALVHGHTFGNNDNFAIYNGHLAIVDYGSISTQEIVFRNFAILNNLPISIEPAE